MATLLRAAALSGLKYYGSEAGLSLRSALLATAKDGSALWGRSYSTPNPLPPDGDTEDATNVGRYRASKNFRRRLDGRVQLYGKDSDTWLEAKLDGYVEGSLLLQGREGLIYYLVSEDLKQIDLSNDQLVGTLFGEGGWERLMQPLYTQTKDGELKHVKMTRQQFRSIFTVLKEAPPQAAAQP